MLGDGDGWVYGAHGAKYWGRYGAAGLFLQAGEHVLMQHRATWTAQGGTWGIPGGARDSHETATDAALRECVEECGIDTALVECYSELVTTEKPGWTYTTVTGEAIAVTPNEESAELRWVHIDQLVELPLHPGFASALQTVLTHAVGHTHLHE